MVANRWSPHKFWLDFFCWQFGGVRLYFRQMPYSRQKTTKFQKVDRWWWIFPSPATPANLAGAEGSGRWMILLLEGDTPPFLSDWGCFNYPNHGHALHLLYHMWYMCLHIYKTCFSMDLFCAKDMMICFLLHVFIQRHCHTLHIKKVVLCFQVVTGHPLRLLSSPVASWMQWHLNLARSFLGVRWKGLVKSSWYPRSFP